MMTLAPSPDVLRATCVAQVSGRMDPSRHRTAGNGVAGVPPELQGAVVSRQLEYLAGRWCAQRALRAIDPEMIGEVGIAADGMPRWPSGFVGSITHTSDFVWAAVASRRDLHAIGIDSEPIIAAARARRLAPCIAGRRAIDRTRDRLEVDLAVATTLQFSAKESLFKCLYAHLGRPFHYLDASVEICPETRSFRARLRPPFCGDLPGQFLIEGWFDLDAGHAHTGVTLRAADAATCVERAQPVD